MCRHPLVVVFYYTADHAHKVSPLEAAAAEIVLNKDDCKRIYCIVCVCVCVHACTRARAYVCTCVCYTVVSINSLCTCMNNFVCVSWDMLTSKDSVSMQVETWSPR